MKQLPLPSPTLRPVLLGFTLLACAALQAAVPGDLLWSQATGGIIYGAPAIGPSGEIVVGSEDGKVYSFNPNGSTRWIFSGATDWMEASPTLSANGTVYAASWDGFLYALDGDTGSLKWKYQTGAFIVASPAIGPDETVYVGSNDGFLYAIHPNGTLRWLSESVNSYAPINGAPVLNASGDTLYFGNDTGGFFALDAATGNKRWSFHVTDLHPASSGDSSSISGAAAIGPDGTIYFGCENSYLYALQADGQLRWHFKAAEPIRSSPVVTSEGTVLFAAQDGYLYALDTEGFQLWEGFVGDVFYCSPAVDAAGNIIVAGYAGSAATGAATRFVSLDASGNLNWEVKISGYNDSSPNIAPDGSILIGAHDGRLYKLAGSAPLMPNGWPRVQANRRQTGLAADLHQTELIDFFPAITLSQSGWAFVPWFGLGWINSTRLPWIQHLDHGHLYLDAPGSTGLWYYDLGLQDWIYGPTNAPSYLYRHGTASWLYHIPGSNVANGRWFYDFGIQNWISDRLL